MLITVDIGNSETVLGLWSGPSLRKTARTATVTEWTKDNWSIFLKDNGFLNFTENPDAIISSVVPEVNSAIAEALRRRDHAGIYQVNLELQLPFNIDRLKYATIGADRLANLCAAARYGQNAIIVDFGTAITFCLMTDRQFRGGLIVPGVHTSISALTSKAAQLPHIVFRKKNHLLGQNTVDSIECGAYYSVKGMVREIIQELKRTISPGGEFYTGNETNIIATGGIVEDLGFTHEFFDIVDPFLTLKGLRLLYEINKTPLQTDLKETNTNA